MARQKVTHEHGSFRHFLHHAKYLLIGAAGQTYAFPLEHKLWEAFPEHYAHLETPNAVVLYLVPWVLVLGVWLALYLKKNVL